MGLKIGMLAGLALAGMGLAGGAFAQRPLPSSHGPANGTLVITGGGRTISG